MQQPQQSDSPETVDELMCCLRDLAAALHDTITEIEMATGAVIDRAALIDAMSDDDGEPIEGITSEIASAIVARCEQMASSERRARLH